MGKRWLGPSHAVKVKKNPLHYSSKIESCLECIRCTRWLHKSAFEFAGGHIGLCKECRETMGIRTS